MGKKRRMLSSKRKFGAKHSSHPRMKHITKTEETETVAVATPVTKPVATAPTTTTTPPEIKTASPLIEDVVTPVTTLKSTETTTVAEKTATPPVITKTKPVKKKAPAKKTRKSTTKSKTISRNA